MDKTHRLAMALVVTVIVVLAWRAYAAKSADARK